MLEDKASHPSRARMQTALCLLTLAAASSALTVKDQFKAFQLEHGKKYSSPVEEAHREKVFGANLKKIEDHNATPGVTWTMVVNQFADLTEEEFKQEVLGGYIKTPQSGNHPAGSSIV